jgi:DNA-binding NtrC family response regulator
MKRLDSNVTIDQTLSIYAPALLRRQKSFTILVASPFANDYTSLSHIFSPFGGKIHRVSSCHDALTFLTENLAGVSISDCDLPDGEWKDILAGMSRLPSVPPLIVASHFANERLWAEVLNLGGYDLLIKPFDLKEAARVISMALRNAEDLPERVPCKSQEQQK